MTGAGLDKKLRAGVYVRLEAGENRHVPSHSVHSSCSRSPEPAFVTGDAIATFEWTATRAILQAGTPSFDTGAMTENDQGWDVQLR